MLINRMQHGVPIPTVSDLSSNHATPCQRNAISVFISRLALTEILGKYLEYVYRVSKAQQDELETTSSDALELLLSQWEETLDADSRQSVIRGTNMNWPGTANLRLSYLAVKLLLKRIQLDFNTPGIVVMENRLKSARHMQAPPAAEDVVHFVLELQEPHLRGFWLPANAFTLTSANFLPPTKCSLVEGRLSGEYATEAGQAYDRHFTIASPTL